MMDALNINFFFHHTYYVILLNIICIDRMLASLNNTLQILVKHVGLVDVLVFLKQTTTTCYNVHV